MLVKGANGIKKSYALTWAQFPSIYEMKITFNNKTNIKKMAMASFHPVVYPALISYGFYIDMFLTNSYVKFKLPNRFSLHNS